ncbi:N/A [soil metagenome]
MTRPATAAQSPVVVYLADDLSGANSSASLLYEAGLRAVHVVEYDRLEAAVGDGQAYVVDLASRDADESLAGERLKACIGALERRLERPILWGKRIDSTLRGHIVLELRVLRKALGRGPALVAPAFPQAGRTTVGGYQLVDGRPVTLGGEPLLGHLPSLLAGAGYHALQPLSLLDLRACAPPALLGALGQGDALVADAAEDADLATLAAWTLDAWLGGALIVDSGPYLARLVRAGVARGLWPGAPRPSPVLVVLGSRSVLTERQVRHLCGACPGVLRLRPDADDSLLARAQAAEVVVLEADGEKVIDGALAALAEALERLLNNLPAPYALIVSGGRTASSVLSRFGVRSLSARGEVFPLVPLSHLAGGTLDGSLLVTKGGCVGDTETLTQTVKFLKFLRRLT